MLKGDLTATPLAPLLLQLADESATGCLHISDAEGDEALIYFKAGLVYAVSVPGRRPQLGAKLVSSGALAPEALADALEAQRSELQGWRLGELLVHLGYVDQPVVEAFISEQVHDALWDLIRWDEGRWRFRKNEKTREDVAPPMLVADLLSDLRERGAEWEAISAVVHGPTAVPVLSARGGGAPETMLDADAWSMLCKIDGERSAAELARDCGYTLFEAGQVLVTLVKAGLVDIEEDVDVAASFAPAPADNDEDRYGASSVSSALAAAADEDADNTDAVPVDDADAVPAEDVVPAETNDGGAGDGDEFAALARLVSEVAASTREDAVADSVAEPDEVYPTDEPAVAERTEDDDVAAAVAAIASLTAERAEETASPVPLHPLVDEESFAASIARVSSALADVLGPPPQADDPFEVPAELRIKRAPKRDKAPARTPETERRERLRAAAAAELATAHALAEALRASQNEEAAVADVVDLQEVRREAEEAARVAAEEEAARVAAEEEAARVAAEEEAARIAAEEEAARIAAEEEAARVAAEEEAARIAAEEEAARVAAEEEAARLAAEEEAARIAAEEEAARLAAEEEEARLLAEAIAQAEDEAWSEYWTREADELSQREADAERAAAEEAER